MNEIICNTIPNTYQIVIKYISNVCRIQIKCDEDLSKTLAKVSANFINTSVKF